MSGGCGCFVLILNDSRNALKKKTRRFMSLPVHMNAASVSTATIPVPVRPQLLLTLLFGFCTWFSCPNECGRAAPLR